MRRFRPSLESLGERLTPATTTFTAVGATASWTNAANWSNGVPDSGDVAVIPEGAAAEITNARGTVGVLDADDGWGGTLRGGGGDAFIVLQAAVASGEFVAEGEFDWVNGLFVTAADVTFDATTTSAMRFYPTSAGVKFDGSGPGVFRFRGTMVFDGYFGGQCEFADATWIGNGGTERMRFVGGVNVVASGTGSVSGLDEPLYVGGPATAFAVANGGDFTVNQDAVEVNDGANLVVGTSATLAVTASRDYEDADYTDVSVYVHGTGSRLSLYGSSVACEGGVLFYQTHSSPTEGGLRLLGAENYVTSRGVTLDHSFLRFSTSASGWLHLLNWDNQNDLNFLKAWSSVIAVEGHCGVGANYSDRVFVNSFEADEDSHIYAMLGGTPQNTTLTFVNTQSDDNTANLPHGYLGGLDDSGQFHSNVPAPLVATWEWDEYGDLTLTVSNAGPGEDEFGDEFEFGGD